MKKYIKKLNISIIINIISIIILLFLFLDITKLNIISLKLKIIIISILFLINLIFILSSNTTKKILKIISICFLILNIIINSTLLFYIKETNIFLSKAFNNTTTENINTFYVVGKKSKNYNLKNIKKISYYKDDYKVGDALTKLDSKTKTKLKSNKLDNINELFDKDGVFLISKTSFDLVTSLDKNYSKNNYKIISKINIVEKIRVKKSTESNKFNVFIGGRDFTGNNMDLNMIMTVNLDTNKVLLTSIPRDTYIEVPGYGKKDTLSYMVSHGINTNISSLEKFLDIKIDYYIELNTNSIVKLVDILGGIDFCSDYDFITTHALVLDTYVDNGKKLRVRKGCQQLNGIETLTLSRERNAFPGRDRVRQKNCQQIAINIVKKLLTTNTITNYKSVITALSDTYKTNISEETVGKIISKVIKNPDITFIQQLTDGEDTKDYVHMSTLIDWVLYPNQDTVNQASSKIKEVLNEK